MQITFNLKEIAREREGERVTKSKPEFNRLDQLEFSGNCICISMYNAIAVFTIYQRRVRSLK